ncbi:glutamate synthase [Spirochaetia bacterium]|nr:glutamate synthase [Spirochaetia bacterium]
MSVVTAALERRLTVPLLGDCAVTQTRAFVQWSRSQSCGKCVPCRIGLLQLEGLFDVVLSGAATAQNKRDAVIAAERLGRVIRDSADCAIGFEAAAQVLESLKKDRADYDRLISGGAAAPAPGLSVPCVSYCPANVDIPGYIALTQAGRYADAVRLIRKDNPFPATCGLICEHPCEEHCRRSIIDSALNIRGLKRFAVEYAGAAVPVPKRASATGKKIAILGGGPAGLTAAYFLALMGHNVAVFERRKYLGGMLRYGIPSYRLPRETLQWDIDAILSAGGITVTTEISPKVAELQANHDALFVAIGAHGEKHLGVDGEGMRGVMSAVALLREVSPGPHRSPETRETFDLIKGKTVLVVGGGNVAMDAARTALRLGAASVSIVYRRRKEDMTALPSEVEAAVAEGCQLLTMMAPVRVEGEGDEAKALVVQPQLPGPLENGRPKPVPAKKDSLRLSCDLIIVAVGQAVEKGIYDAKLVTKVFFDGGDCATGPATVIKAIAAGKDAARRIDAALGFDHHIMHPITVDVDIPAPPLKNKPPLGRVEPAERLPLERRGDFDGMEICCSAEEAAQETGRCLRCDRSGYGAFRGGRVTQW